MYALVRCHGGHIWDFDETIMVVWLIKIVFHGHNLVLNTQLTSGVSSSYEAILTGQMTQYTCCNFIHKAFLVS